jgi:RNA polymerase sigma-70 factor (ECF subfamily)
MSVRTKLDYETLDDLALAGLVAARDREAVRLLTQRNNQRLFRAAWSILRNRSEAEDAVQGGYLRAIAAIGTFEGRSSLSTWLTRIVVNEALGRLRAAKRRRARLDEGSVTVLDDYREKLMRGSAATPPDAALVRAQLRRLLEDSIAALPQPFRTVFVLREVEGLSVEETAETLAILPATVKTRHLRARRRLQDSLAPEVKSALEGTFPFAGPDCARMTERVLAAI